MPARTVSSVAAADELKPFWQAPGGTAKLWHGDVLGVLRRLPSRSVQCVVTSPPYWGLRDYGTGTWEGGDPACDHRLDIERKVNVTHNAGSLGGKPRPGTDGANTQGKFVLRCPKCGARRIDAQLGSEARPDCLGWARGENCAERDWASGCHVCRMVLVFREVRRVLRDDGTLWLNYGDTYSSGNCGGESVFAKGRTDGRSGNGGIERTRETRSSMKMRGESSSSGLSPGNLVGVPWRVALALQADGWILRQEIIWCLSGGTWVYVRSQKGDMPMMVRDLARLDPTTVQLWNGNKWTRLLGMNRNQRQDDEIELVLRSGERISCTSTHKFPSKRGLLQADQLCVGDCLIMCRLPEPDAPKKPAHIDNDAAWFAGLYLAEGCGVETGKINIAGHVKEVARWDRVKKVVAAYGGSCTLTEDGNNQLIRVYGKVINAIVKELVSGKTAKDKGIAVAVWQFDDDFVCSFMEGYLGGDGHWDAANKRWRLGFTRNYNLERDLRVACARLGWYLTLNTSTATANGQTFPSFRGEIRTEVGNHWNNKDRCEIVEIRKARCREVYDLGVEDDPHTFALASGVLTHNSKPSPMPESVRNRCTKAHEHVFLLVKRAGYFCDMEAIKEPAKSTYSSDSFIPNSAKDAVGYFTAATQASRNNRSPEPVKGNSNKRSVWTVASEGFAGAHFATFTRELIRPMILAGTSERGACARCGAPWRRVMGPASGGATGKAWLDHSQDTVAGNFKTVSSAGYRAAETVGWQPTCECCGKSSSLLLGDLETIESPAGAGGGPDDPSLITGRAGMNRPRNADEGKRLMTRYEQRKYAEQLRASPHRADMKYEAGAAFSHYERTDRSGARPIPPALLQVWLARGWLSKVELPVIDPPPIAPCVVLDPFVGSGTAAALAVELGRTGWGIDLSRKYLEEFAAPRLMRLTAFRFAETKAYRALNSKMNQRLAPRQKLGKKK